jgi:hypothetical protein
MFRPFRAAIARVMKAAAPLLVPMLVSAAAVQFARADDKPVTITLEHGEAARSLKDMGLVEKDFVLMIQVLDLAGGAGAKPVTIGLAEKEKKTISLKPAAAGRVKMRFNVSYRNQACINNTDVETASGKTIRISLKTNAPTCELKW